MCRRYRWYFAQIYSEDLQENVLRPHYGPDDGSDTDRNEYKGYFLGG